MKIKRLELKAFGPFSGCVLDFSSDIPGLHIVYGPNESGKSSSMRALQALLFGFPSRTSDNFLHSYDQLQIGGCLQGMDGKELVFSRRKKRVHDLFDENDAHLDPSALIPYLHGIERDLFTTLYGIDHESLVKGGQGILDQQGDVGQAMFSAGAGLASLKSVLDALEEEGDNLFRPRGSTKAINEAIAQHKELQIQIKQATLSSREWQDHQARLEDAERQKAETAALLGKLNGEKHQLERLKQALPYLGQRKRLIVKLAELGFVVELPLDFGERRKSIEQQGRDARSRFETAKARLHELQEKKKGVSLKQGLLDHADAIENLHQSLGQYRKAGNDRPRIEGQRISSRNEGEALLKGIRPDLSIIDIENLRPGLSKKKTIQGLGARHEALLQAARKAGRLVDATRKALEKAQMDIKGISCFIEAGNLLQALAFARKSGDLDQEIKTKNQLWDAFRKACMGALKRLGLWEGPLHLAGQLAIPLPESLKRYEDQYNSLSDEKRRVVSERQQIEADLAHLLTQLHEIEYAAEVPTEAELRNNRKRRDHGWQLLRREWLQGEDVAKESHDYDCELPLPDAYEKQVAFSDQTADRLYREADRVQKHASLKAIIEGNKKRLAEVVAHDAHIDFVMAETEQKWQELWATCGIRPLSPREMAGWLNSFDKLRFQAAESDKIAGDIALLNVKRKDIRDMLLSALAGKGQNQEFSGEELSPVLLHAETMIKRFQEDHVRYEKLAGKIGDLTAALETARLDQQNAEEELNQWQAMWTNAIFPLGLDGRTTPSEAADFIETLQGCFDKLKEADEFRKRIDGIDRDACGFEASVRDIAGNIAPDLAGPDVSQVISELKSRLSQAIQEQAVLHAYEKEISLLEKIITVSRTDLGISEEIMADLCQQAGCKIGEELNEAERRSGESMKLKSDLDEVENAIARIGEGMSINDFEVQAGGIDPDELPGRIAMLGSEIEDRLNPEIQRLSEIIGQEKNELKRMDGGTKAAELADASQQTIAKIRRLTERYIRLKLAAKILREEIDRYRSENQDPVLTIASRYFQKLTISSFMGLRTDIDDQGQPVLIGVRPNNDWVHVAGMSSGTRDQLYLALRLATLEWRMASGEPMPFIVDDILINFDDDRSKATLEALSDLAGKTQVILFTHHRQIFEAARSLHSDESVFIHNLSSIAIRT
jgi:uncharacterized protein YhaN